MLKEKFIWVNGKFIPWGKANIHILNHSLHYGSAVFEGIRFYKTEKGVAIFRLSDHLNRLFYSAKTMGMNILYSKKQLTKTILDLIKKNKLTSGYIRPIVFYGSKMGLNPIGADINIVIACWSWEKYLDKEVVKVKISSYLRLHPQSSAMGAKISGHYFNSILATLEVKKQGFDEALLLDYKGNIAEGPGENIFFVKNKIFYTPPSDSILSGITRDTIMTLLKDLGYQIKEKNIKPIELKNFNEAFFTGTAVEITGIGQINKIKIGNNREGTLTKTLKENYNKIVRGEIKKYEKWLTYIK